MPPVLVTVAMTGSAAAEARGGAAETGAEAGGDGCPSCGDWGNNHAPNAASTISTATTPPPTAHRSCLYQGIPAVAGGAVGGGVGGLGLVTSTPIRWPDTAMPGWFHRLRTDHNPRLV